MDKALLIVESPAKAKTIKKYVGDGFEVLASKGHIKDLPKRGGVDLENGFQETYEVLSEKGKDEVETGYEAGDLDRFAALATEWRDDGRDAYVFLINGAKRRAPAAAMALQERLGIAPA